MPKKKSKKENNLSLFYQGVSSEKPPLQQLFGSVTRSVDINEEEIVEIPDDSERQSIPPDTQEKTDEYVGEPVRRLFSTTPSEANTATIDLRDDYDALLQKHEGDPYAMLANIILYRNEEVKEGGDSKREYFNHRLAHIIPAVEFVVEGTRQKLADVDKDSDEAQELAQRITAFQTIQDMLMSLHSLSKNKTRYAKEHYAQRIEKLMSMLPPEGQQPLAEALNAVIEENLFNKRKFYQTGTMGSTEFNASQPEMVVNKKYQKRVKFEHRNNGQEVSALFSYSRNTILGHGVKKMWKNRAEEYKEFRDQIRDLMNKSISEHNKGSEANPLKIGYIGPDQPETALALLFEFKKRAHQQGRSFFALNETGQPIEITSEPSFSDEERAYFMHFAKGHPALTEGEKPKITDSNAGYKLFQYAFKVDKEDLKDAGKLSEALDTFLGHELRGVRQEQKQRLEQVAGELKNMPSSRQTQRFTI